MIQSEGIPVNTFVPNVGGVVGLIWYYFIEVQPLNAYPPILVTQSGIIILVKEVQLINALLSILVTLLGILILVKELQFLNENNPIVFTPFEILTVVKEVHP